ncbi:unnamed protein product [Sphenostylis stenocarpa]|uniref:Uncharacterized protein n=1 Tax=Sphenostylis stenocarpa TaxID=92480 RepID=A0AA86SKD1_9FABA|nr:unnamed protein product [Sphenostylis stenocarpa]
MANTEENDDTKGWSVVYKIGQMKNQICCFHLGASREFNRVKNITFSLSDNSANNQIQLHLGITRVGRDRLRGGIGASVSSGGGNLSSPMSFKRDMEDLSIETTIAPYGCSDREGLVVLEKKKLLYSRDAYMVNVAHYYLTGEVGVSVAAKVRRNKGHGFVVEVEGPFVHPSADLRKVIEQTCRSGVWSPGACSHCNNGASSSTVSSLTDKKLSEILKRLSSSGNASDQVYTGLVNASGYTNVLVLVSFVSDDGEDWSELRLRSTIFNFSNTTPPGAQPVFDSDPTVPAGLRLRAIVFNFSNTTPRGAQPVFD